MMEMMHQASGSRYIRAMTTEPPIDPPAPGQVGQPRNLGEPIHLANVEIAGFVRSAPAPGQNFVEVWTSLGLTSEDPHFHRIVEGFESVVLDAVHKAGARVNVRRASTVLLVIHPDKRAELWVDTAFKVVGCLVKRQMRVGQIVVDRDVADITNMAFPHVPISEDDKVLCLFREGWSFGFACFTEANAKLDLDWFWYHLGGLVRRLRYRHLYQVVETARSFEHLLAAGWFPFAEIINAEFGNLAALAEAGHPLDDAEQRVLAGFDDVRVDHVLARWLTRPHYASREKVLTAAINAFKAKDPISVIKNLLTEIEGVLNDAHRAANNGTGARMPALLKFAQDSAEGKAGGPNTLMFPKAFGIYLKRHTFANFDPVAQTGTASSRHAVGHGAAAQDTYTMTRALQAILTVDQLAF
jgi:hypothetical protein